MTTDAAYQRAMALFESVCDLPPEEREARLSALTDDPEALRLARSLLAEDDASGGALSDSRHGAGAERLAIEMARAMPEAPAPATIGGYRVLRLIGRGGMGSVYEAEQDNPRRRVALKVVRADMATPALVRRFLQEAQLLGRLQHPGVAHVYEAGSAMVDGAMRPFIAMEHIDGLPLDQHTRQANLSIPERLELVARIADAVQHAHQKGVIHRDLKPANVLVVKAHTTTTPGERPSHAAIDAIGQPKVVDFGVARAIEAGARETMAGQLIGTLAYMSPEQVRTDSDDVDTRSDIYALGVMAYELVSGRLPHAVDGRTIAGAGRAILDDEPAPLGALDTSFRGDVEVIIAKAIDKDRERRYESAAEFAADIRRHLRDEPIHARPARTIYQLRKFVRRNRHLVAGGVVASFAIAIGVGVSAYGLVAARRERAASVAAMHEERHARDVAEAVTRFFSDALGAANPSAMGRNVTVREVLDAASAQVGDRFAGSPGVEASIRSAIGRTFVSLGEYDLAEEQIAQAVSILADHQEPADPAMLAAYTALGEARYFQGRIEDAANVLGTVLRHARETYPPGDPRLIEPIGNVAFMETRLGRFDEAEGHYREAIAIIDATPDADPQLRIDLRGNRAQLLAISGRQAEAASAYAPLIEEARRSLGPEHPQTILLMSNLASVYKNAERWAEAIPLLEETLVLQERVVGEDHSKTLITLNVLADALGQVRRLDEAEALVGEGLTRAAAAYGKESAPTAFLLLTRGRIHEQAGNAADAERDMTESIELSRRLHGDAAELTFSAAMNRVRMLNGFGLFDRALPHATALFEFSLEEHGEIHSRTRVARIALARTHMGLGRHADAEAILDAAYQVANDARARSDVARVMAEVCDASGRTDDAARWRAEAAQTSVR